MTILRILAAATLASLSTMWTASAQPKEQRFTVINGTDIAIEYFYFASCGAGAWGKDRLGSKEIIKPGARKQFGIRGSNDNCCHDMRAKLQTGASRQKLNTDVCRESEWVVH